MIRLIGLLLMVVAVMTWLVVPAGSDERPPAEVVLYVVDESGIEDAGLDLAYELRGQGYAIAGTEISAALFFQDRRATTVFCRAGFERERATLVEAIGSRADEAKSPPAWRLARASSPWLASIRVDCIVGLPFDP